MCFIIRNPAHPIERQLHFPGEGKITADDIAILTVASCKALMQPNSSATFLGTVNIKSFFLT